MQTIDANARVLLDETGVNLAMTRLDARAPQGQRAYASTPVTKGKHSTVLGALSRDGIIAAMTVEGSTDTEVFLTYVPTILVPTWRPGQIVLMDNLSSHKDERIQTAIDSVGATLEY
jgi:DDE superfamily endonuclease